MAQVINVQEFKDEGFAIITDTQGKYLVSANTDKVEEIPQFSSPFIPRNPCALVQSRASMLT